MSAEEFGRTAVLVILLLAAVFAGVVLVDHYRRRRQALVYRAALMAWNGWSPAPQDPRLVAFGTRLGLQGQPTQMLVTVGHHELTGAEIMARLETMAGVIDRIPPFVFRDYGAVS